MVTSSQGIQSLSSSRTTLVVVAMSESNICIRYTRVDLEMYQGAYRASFEKLDSRIETIKCLQRVFDR